MKTLKLIIPLAGLLLAGTTAYSQTVHETNQLLGTDLNGTARFVGMGGAMSALGGDISTMGTNPAGIGIYRSSDINVSFGFSNVGNRTKGSATIDTDKTFGSFDNAGFVISLKQGNYTPVRYVNFGFNYRKVKSFDRDMWGWGDYNSSQTQQFARMANGISPENLQGGAAFRDENVPWLGVLAYQSFLINPAGNNSYSPYFNSNNTTLSSYNSSERGAIHSYDFNIALNFNDRFYLGATIGAYDVDYRKSTIYGETFTYQGEDEGFYELSNYQTLDGTGVDFKLGAILRPFEDSPFRVGLAVHTPTFYSLTLRNDASIYYEVEALDEGEYKWIDGTATTENDRGEYIAITDYSLRTPWKFNFSLGHTIGSNIALGAEYEYMDYSYSSLKNFDDYDMPYENGQISSMLRGVNTFRLGAEFKVVPQFSLRAGYNHSTASMQASAYQEIPFYSVRTDTDYANTKAINSFTFGFGYRGEHFYADMAYQYRSQKEDFYSFQGASSIDVSNNKHQLLLSLGMRF